MSVWDMIIMQYFDAIWSATSTWNFSLSVSALSNSPKPISYSI